MDSTSPLIACFWEGQPLPILARFCIDSWISRGYQIELFCYDPGIAIDLPKQVIVSDANLIISKTYLFPEPGKRTGYSGFSNLFRMEVMRHRNAIWVDLDAFATKKIDFHQEYIFAKENKLLINGAIFKAPGDSKLVSELISKIQSADKTFWVFGDLGPVALTRQIKDLGLQYLTLPSKYFYEVDPLEIWKLYSPRFTNSIKNRLQGTYFLHMSNELAKRMPFNPFELRPPQGSYLQMASPIFWSRFSDVPTLTKRQMLYWITRLAWMSAKSRISRILPSSILRRYVRFTQQNLHSG